MAARVPAPHRALSSSAHEAEFLVVGHRGSGMNVLQSSDLRFNAIKENTLLSFNSAAKYAVDFVEFDVQVTRDGCPIIFHDDFLYSEEGGTLYEKRVTDLSLPEFLSYGPQKTDSPKGKKLLRKARNGEILHWSVESDDFSCTLQEAFEKVNPAIGFNIELKFDDHFTYSDDLLMNVLSAILKVVVAHANERPIIFSTFQPDAALIIRKLQGTYPVYFLTNGGIEMYHDNRRNSLEEAVKLCIEGGLQGIVSEVIAVLRNPEAVKIIKEAKLSLLTYGALNNVAEVVYVQHLMGVDGVIVDFIKEITEGVSRTAKSSDGDEQGWPKFSKSELEFLLKLIPVLLTSKH